MKQTAVEWLAEQMMHPSNHNPYIEQAKEMEKQQIIDAVTFGQNNHTVNISDDLAIAKQYYNEQFKNK
jgi:hypothetical protein